jgi:flagellar motor switch protein FliG
MRTLALAIALAVFGLTPARPALAKVDVGEITQRSAEKQVRNLVEPLLDKYCREECKLMSVNVTVDVANADDSSPGFDELDPRLRDSLAPSFARVKLLLDQKLGPVSRSKLLELIQQYLDTLDFPVKVETQTAFFPQPTTSSSKVAEMREKISKRFRDTLDELFRQFCPEQCLLADLNLRTELVNMEEAQYGDAGEFLQDGDVAIRVREISATLLMVASLSPEERDNLLEIAKLKASFLKNVNLTPKLLKFPAGLHEGALAGAGGFVNSRALKNALEQSTTTNSSQSNSSNNSKNQTVEKTDNTNTSRSASNNASTENRKESYSRFERVERVEQGDAIHKEMQKFKVYGLIFACSMLSLLIFIAIATLRPPKGEGSTVHRFIQSFVPKDPVDTSTPFSTAATPQTGEERMASLNKRYEIERLKDELMQIFATMPKVAKTVFSKVLTEDGVEITAHYVHILGENVVLDMLRDPSLQADMAELMDFYAKNTFELTENDQLELLQKLHNRTIAGKIAVFGNRSSLLFDFLAEMDGLQILEMIRNESLTVKAIVLTQCDLQKRATIYAQLDESSRLLLLAELSRIDYLPRDYIYNVANALKRKRRENPKLNTEALPGSEVLVSLLERTGPQLQRTVIRNLEAANPDSARAIKGKLVCLDTLRFLRDGQLLEVVLSLRHDELLQFLKGAPGAIRSAIFAKSPKELTAELEDELGQIAVPSREVYQGLERKIINRMKIMANEGLINLVETNERMFAETRTEAGFVEAQPSVPRLAETTQSRLAPHRKERTHEIALAHPGERTKAA